ncbi:MAG: DUF4390 domain-containing protein [Betaproteobacteria bacterium]
MTVFTMHCWKKTLLKRLLCWLGVLVWLLAVPRAMAQNATEINPLRAERIASEVLVSATVSFDLPSVVEDALLKGVPMFFLLEAEVLQERWYWSDKKIAGAQRQLRLAYQPLTRRWRVNATAGAGGDSPQGQALSQSFETLAQAMAAVRQISQWKIGDLADSEPLAKLKVEFRFRLDLGQLPRPFQIGAIGQSEWDIQAVGRVPLRGEGAK